MNLAEKNLSECEQSWEIRNSKAGFAVSSALFGLALIVAAALLAASIISFFRQNESRSVALVHAKNAVLEAASLLRASDYDQIVELCIETSRRATGTNSGAFGIDLLAGSKCFAPGNMNALNPVFTEAEAGPSSNANEPKVVDVRLDLKTGRPSATGSLCVAIQSCEEKIPGQFIRVNLVSLFMDPDPRRAPPISRTGLVVERSRY